MSGVVYQIISKATQRVYIGSTTRKPNQRRLEHLHYLRKGKHHSSYLQRVFNKYGEDDLAFSVLEELPNAAPDEVLDAEQRHLDLCASVCMNTAPVSKAVLAAQAANRGRKMSAEERARRSESAKKAVRKPRDWSAEKRMEHSIRMTGRKMPPVSDATKEKLSTIRNYHNALLGLKAKETCDPFAWIETDRQMWFDMAAKGLSFRKIEKITGRSRLVIARECAGAGQ